MKRILHTFALSLLILLPAMNLASAPVTSATSVFQACSGSNAVAGASATDVCREQRGGTNPVTNAIKVVTLIVSVIAGVAAVIIIIISSFKMVTSNGNPQQFASARSSLLYALIGLVIATLAGTIVGFVVNSSV